ncbi:MAG: hypothetical protein HOH43_09390 [Candidatus Latescibacteria bacterium]|jgi:hypothetical protein|nr:hypothetical protein [Candidatus Latescibacterota bacterium]
MSFLKSDTIWPFCIPILWLVAVLTLVAIDVSSPHAQPLRLPRVASLARISPDIPPAQQVPAMSNRGRKSPARAFALSLLFPGAGELYSGRKRGLVFSALEISALTTSIVHNGRGNDRKATSIAFANAHWDSLLCAPNCLDPSVGTEQLGDSGSQQYYEQIGKYNKFQEGWDDFDPAHVGISPNRDTYVTMQHNMNQAFKRSDWAIGVILLNHFVSAIHAALLVRLDNRKLDSPPIQESKLRLHIDTFDPYGRFAPRATMTLSF